MPMPSQREGAEVSLSGWAFAVDRGGTFTDAVGIDPHGCLHTGKVLSEVPERATDPITAAIDAVLAANGAARNQVKSVRIGTTLATNALLTRTGARTALVTTQGLGDLSWIRDQSRPDLFALSINRPEPIAERVIEVNERLDVAGCLVEPLDEIDLHEQLLQAKLDGIESIAICFVHGWLHSDHEDRAADLARSIGFQEVLTSRDAAMRGFVVRLTTLSADAALSPIIRRGLDPLRKAFRGRPVLCMQSHGGLVELNEFRGINAILSGPAGGVIGARKVAQSAGFKRSVALDMGGTSTDVAWLGDEIERFEQTVVEGERLAVPMIGIHTVAAGGGSVCRFDGQRLRVGPQSAGAFPGPACYRCDGPCALTDCFLVLGRVPLERFPSVFGSTGDQLPSVELASAAVEKLADEVAASGAPRASAESTAEGCLTIAVEVTAAAVRRISIEQGRDLHGAALVAYGGAGGQIACQVAERLGIATVLFHPIAGLLSAWGIGQADRQTIQRRSFEQTLDDASVQQAERLLQDLEEELAGQHEHAQELHIAKRAMLRSHDWDRGIVVEWSDSASMMHQFQTQTRSRFGYDPGEAPLVIATLEVEAVRPGADQPSGTTLERTDQIGQTTRVAIDGEWRAVPVYQRSSIAVDSVIEGPALLLEDGATVFVEPGWIGHLLSDGTLRCDLVSTAQHAVVERQWDERDPVLLSVMSHRFRAIADEMGAVLRATARSVNMRERLDYSCALFDEHGALIANGQHMPVHLGSMSESVRHVIGSMGSQLQSGDAVLLNDPFRGGTHLPDLTLVSPLFLTGQSSPAFYVASRGHHADIGGVAPGSMSPDATSLEQEGVVIDAMLLCRHGTLRTDELRRRLVEAKHPCRSPDRVIDDLRAQLASNQRGLVSLQTVVDEYGAVQTKRFASALQRVSEQAVRNLQKTLTPGSAMVPMDGGGQIRVSVQTDAPNMVFNFDGTSPQRPECLNAPPAVTKAAVLYVLRCLLQDDIPLNEGCLNAVEVRIPDGCLLKPSQGAAVAGGNVETSQLVVDALFMALGVLANSQGTMNNFSFGDEQVQYYETICGGSGAGPGFNGASAVQSHMTNSRLTDPEVFEDRYPVLVRRFQRRHNSGGLGQWGGGDGVVRELEFRRTMTASLLASRREYAPMGAEGASDGLPGEQILMHEDGTIVSLIGRWTRSIAKGDRLTIKTPGGGGWGTA